MKKKISIVFEILAFFFWKYRTVNEAEFLTIDLKNKKLICCRYNNKKYISIRKVCMFLLQ